MRKAIWGFEYNNNTSVWMKINVRTTRMIQVLLPDLAVCLNPTEDTDQNPGHFLNYLT